MNYPPKINSEKEEKIITKFIAETFRKANKKTAVIAVSGGLDSSTTLMLTANALQPLNVQVLYLPSKITDPIHLEHTILITKKTKIPAKNITTINIGGIVQKTWKIIKRSSKSPLATKGTKDRKKINQQIAKLNRLRLANISARIRMTVIFDQAKLHNSLVIGTENQSEHLLGYYTRFGDEASDLEPIRHLYKTQLQKLAKFLKVPKPILDKAPSADLWRGQTDASELGFSYKNADPILFLKYEQNMSPNDIVQKLKKSTRKNSKEIERLVSKVLGHSEAFSFKHHLPYTIY